MLVLESETHAKNRGAEILAELAGYGASDDAFHITQPSPGGIGAYKAMEKAIANANLNINQIDYINAHGTSTPFNDKNESEAIQNLFKDHSKKIKVSSTKSMTGHLLGAAGGIEAVSLVKAINEQVIPPTINYDNPDPDCTLDYVPNYSQELEFECALSNTFGFGGHNAVICIKILLNQIFNKFKYLSPKPKSIANIEKNKLHFQNKHLIEQAFTHKSIHHSPRLNYERLEFLGDSVLDMIISRELMREFPDGDEGLLTQRRAALVQKPFLANMGRLINLMDYLKIEKNIDLKVDKIADKQIANILKR